MSTLNANTAAAPRQVACVTSDNDQVPVDLNVLRVSGTFKDMCDDLGLDEHDEFQGVFPVETVRSRIFKRVIDWCREHKDDPEPIVEKDPLTHECKCLAADYLDIPRLYHYACQSVASRIKGKSPRRIGAILLQNCDLDDDQIGKVLDDNPWLDRLDAFSGARFEKAVFIPNEVLVTIFEKLPRKDLERLQLVSTQFSNVIESSSALSARQGPLRVVTKVEFGAHFDGSPFSQHTDVWLRDGTRVTCTGFEDLAKRLKFAIVQQLRWDASTRWFGSHIQSPAYIQGLSSLLPVKTAWKNATVKASVDCFPSTAAFEFVFTQLLFCKEIVLVREYNSFTWPLLFMRLPAVAAYNKLDVSGLTLFGDFIPTADVIEWLEHEAPPATTWSEPRQMTLHERGIDGGIDGLLTALKAAFSASTSPKPYIVRIRQQFHLFDAYEVLANEKTHEELTIRAEQNGDVSVMRT